MTSGVPRLEQMTIDGIIVPAGILANSDLNPQLGKLIKSITITLSKAVYDTIPNIRDNPRGLSVVVKRGVSSATETFVFQGEIVERITQGISVQLLCYDKLFKATKRNVTKTFDQNIDTEAGKISEIFITLLRLAGLTGDSTSITDSGTAILIDKFICNNVDIQDRLEILAELLDWQFFYDPTNDKVFFQPKGTRTGTHTLTVGGNVSNRPKWNRDSKNVVKKAVLFGGPIDTQTQETFSGDASTTEFTLAKLAKNVKIVVDSSLQTGGIENQSTGADYFVRKVIKTGSDTQVSQIKFDSGSVPSNNSNNIVVDYSVSSPIVLEDENAISEGIDTRLYKPDLITVEDARKYLSTFTARHSSDFLSTSLAVTNITDMEVGQSVRVIDAEENIDSTFIITSIRKKFPYAFDEVKVDNEPIETEEWDISIEDRIRRIEERLLEEETLVIHVRSGNRTIKLGREFSKLQSRDIRDGGGEYSFILGHPDGGVLGTNLLGDRRQAAVDLKIQQGGGVYIEDFLSDDFEGAGNASWSNTGSATFTSGQIALSSSIELNTGTITKARLISTEVSGSFTYELSADGGSNFETITSGNLHTFTNTGTDLRFRATENAASTGEISEIKIDQYT